MKNKVYAIIVTYNGEEWCERCIGSLIGPNNIKVIVVDNNSDDNTVNIIKEKFPSVILFEEKENLGFALANNKGIRYAVEQNADYILLLNQDAWVNGDSLTNMLDVFNEDNNIGIISPLHLNGKSNKFDDFFVSCLPYDYINDIYFHNERSYYEVDFINAAAWLISSKCIKDVGGFDTLLFKHYGEDNNYCQRAIYHGYKVVISTNSTICHDRKQRTKNYVMENNFNIFNKDRHLKIELGDIQRDIDFEKLLFERKKLMKRYYFTFRLKKYKQIKKEISLYKTILKSREINKKKGLNWL